MPDEQQTQQQSKPRKQSKDTKAEGYDQALEQGYVGQVAEDPPNEAYQVTADHEATAEAQRKALRERRSDEADRSREGS
jgi:hypothetical protein